MIGPHQRFTALQRLLHWLMAACILAMLFIGVGMVSTVMPKYLPLIATHKSLGIAILVLALIRLAVRLRYGAPALPADLPEPMKLAAYVSHYALYALMIAMPLLGWAMLSAAAYPVVVFGNTVLPPILPQSDSLHTLLWSAHFYLAFAFFALVLMHVAAALFHALVRRDGVFDAMAPWPSHDKAAALFGLDRGNSDAVRAAAAPSKSLEETS
jgi:cytochrome b561